MFNLQHIFITYEKKLPFIDIVNKSGLLMWCCRPDVVSALEHPPTGRRSQPGAAQVISRRTPICV
jgi:hypothetical protein